ncbi:MAG: type II toxin-antitoxin system prevent-host-death family antitoxin [Cyanobacteria bacterium P01_C01_bin.72]
MQISKSKLKSKLLEILREVESANTEVIVTDRGRPVAKISKFQNVPTTEELFQDLRGQVKYFEEPTAPTIEEWGDKI